MIKDGIKTRCDDNGIVIIGLKDFLINPESLDY